MARDGKGRGTKAGRTVVAVVLLAVSAPAVFSAPFDAVVPREIRVDTTSPAFRVTIQYWGWIAPTADSLTAADLDGAAFTAEPDTAAVGLVLGPFTNVGAVSPLRTGEVAGLRLDPYNTVQDTLLEAGETLKAPDTGFFLADITFPSGFTDTVLVTATITMAGEELSYVTTVIFGEMGLSLPMVAEGQRVASAPVPAAVEPATWGSIKTRFLPGRNRRR